MKRRTFLKSMATIAAAATVTSGCQMKMQSQKVTVRTRTEGAEGAVAPETTDLEIALIPKHGTGITEWQPIQLTRSNDGLTNVESIVFPATTWNTRYQVLAIKRGNHILFTQQLPAELYAPTGSVVALRFNKLNVAFD